MEAVVIARGDGPRTSARGRVGGPPARAGKYLLGLGVLAVVAGAGGPAAGQGPPSRIVLSHDRAGPPRPSPAPPPAVEVPRFRIRDEAGDCVVARLHDRSGDRVLVMAPDGQLGFPRTLVPTDEPFVPVTAEALRRRLERGPYAGFQVLTTPHYLVFYKSRPAFAQDSARLLEELYRGLIDFCHRHEIPVHESEFPLVAVIFATEAEFRARQKVAPEVQAYYEVFPNRIYFYEESERDRNEPKLVALRKPQTVAHEGAHQILANIGVQPRPLVWPIWLTEGLAEFCATPGRGKKGLTYDRLGTINALHMVTLRELDDPLSNEPIEDDARAKPPARSSRLLDAEALVTRTDLTPTDYAQAWALTHYLTQKRADEFVKYLRTMSRIPPLEPRTPAQHLSEFRAAFGEDLARLDRKGEDYIRKLIQGGKFAALPYYAVIVEQPIGGGMVRRRAWISQSPQVIQRWVEENVTSQGGLYNWEAVPFPTRARAEIAAQNWVRGY